LLYYEVVSSGIADYRIQCDRNQIPVLQPVDFIVGLERYHITSSLSLLFPVDQLVGLLAMNTSLVSVFNDASWFFGVSSYRAHS